VESYSVDKAFEGQEKVRFGDRLMTILENQMSSCVLEYIAQEAN